MRIRVVLRQWGTRSNSACVFVGTPKKLRMKWKNEISRRWCYSESRIPMLLYCPAFVLRQETERKLPGVEADI